MPCAQLIAAGNAGWRIQFRSAVHPDWSGVAHLSPTILNTHSMNSSAAYSFIHHLDDGSLKVASAPDVTKKWLQTLGLPLEMLQFMQGTWPQKNCQVGPVELLCSKNLPLQENIEALLAHKLLPVGSGPNGDTFVIDFSVAACPVGFITHEEYNGEGDPRKFLRIAARALESFLYRVSERRFFPCDYYETGDFNDFLREESAHRQFPPYDPIKA